MTDALRCRFAFVLLPLLLVACVSDDRVTPPDDGAVAPMRTVSDDGLPQPDSVTSARFEAVMAFAQEENLGAEPMGEVMQALGERFIEAPYIVGPLDEQPQEVLVCRLDGFDCFTYVESVLAMARGIQRGDYSWEGFAERIREQRYRSGEIDGYCSRMHYFSEWIAHNEERGLIRNITQQLGGERLPKSLDYMSTHRDSYPNLRADSTYQCIQQMEQDLRDLELYYIPQDRIDDVYDQLQPGDLIATATDIEGLDVTHTGLVYAAEPGERKGLMHASTSGGVKVSPDLQSYVQNINAQIGIVVARPVAPGDAASTDASPDAN